MDLFSEAMNKISIRGSCLRPRVSRLLWGTIVFGPPEIDWLIHIYLWTIFGIRGRLCRILYKIQTVD